MKYALATEQRLEKFRRGDEAPPMFLYDAHQSLTPIAELRSDGLWNDTLLPELPLTRVMAGGILPLHAAIWNAHRIHFDESYTTEVEQYPGVVVDGPLQGDWLSQVVTEWLGEDGELVEFEYSNRKASYLGEHLRSGGVVTAVDPATGTATVELHIKNAEGAVISPGRAVVRLRD